MTGRRCVFVTAEDERRLRGAFGRIFIATILVVTMSAPFAPFWLRALVILPTSMAVAEFVLRRMTARLPSAPRDKAASFSDANRTLAIESGPKLLWAQLVFFVALVAFCSSGIVSDEDLGWRKYAGVALGAAMIVQVSYQLVILRRSARRQAQR